MDTEEKKETVGPGALLRLLLSAALMLGLIGLLREDELVTVGVETALEGRITRCDVNRQHFNWYLNGQPIRYDLWSFTAGDSATQQMQNRIQEENKDNIYYYNTLAYYLSKGDRLRKAAGSPLLTLQRGKQVTTWTCAPEK